MSQFEHSDTTSGPQSTQVKLIKNFAPLLSVPTTVLDPAMSIRFCPLKWEVGGTQFDKVMVIDVNWMANRDEVLVPIPGASPRPTPIIHPYPDHDGRGLWAAVRIFKLPAAKRGASPAGWDDSEDSVPARIH